MKDQWDSKKGLNKELKNLVVKSYCDLLWKKTKQLTKKQSKWEYNTHIYEEKQNKGKVTGTKNHVKKQFRKDTQSLSIAVHSCSINK